MPRTERHRDQALRKTGGGAGRRLGEERLRPATLDTGLRLGRPVGGPPRQVIISDTQMTIHTQIFSIWK